MTPQMGVVTPDDVAAAVAAEATARLAADAAEVINRNAAIAAHTALTDVHTITRSNTRILAPSDASALSQDQSDAVLPGANDQVVINALIAAGFNIKILEGNVFIGAPITAAVNNVTIEGSGRGTIVNLQAASNCNVVTIGGNGWTLRSFGVDGNGAAQGAGNWYGIYAGNGITDPVTESVNVTDCKSSGIHLRAVIRARLKDIDSSLNGRCGIEIYGAAHEVQMDDINTFGNVSTGVLWAKGVYQSNASNVTSIGDGYSGVWIDDDEGTAECHDLNWINLTVQGNIDGDCLRIWGAYGINVTNFTGIGGAHRGMLFRKVKGINVTGFDLDNNNDSGIAIETTALYGHTASSHVKFVNGTIRRYGTGDGCAVWLDSTDDVHTISDISFDNVDCIADAAGGASYAFAIGDGSHAGQSRIHIHNCRSNDHLVAAVLFQALSGSDDSDVTLCKFFGTVGIRARDGTNLRIIGNRLECVTPLDIDVVAVKNPTVADNDWSGSTNNPTVANLGANGTDRYFSFNVDKDGGWFASTTKSIFLTPHGFTEGVATLGGGFPLVSHADAAIKNTGYGTIVPNDFSSFVSAQLDWYCTLAAGDLYWQMQGTYSAPGEAYNVHDDAPGSGVTATGGANIRNRQSPANPLTLVNLAKGDCLGIKVRSDRTNVLDTLDATAVFLLGVLFTYIGEDTGSFAR